MSLHGQESTSTPIDITVFKGREVITSRSTLEELRQMHPGFSFDTPIGEVMTLTGELVVITIRPAQED